MIDEVILRNGQSRILRTIPKNSEGAIDATLPTTFDDFMDQLTDGVFPVDILYPTVDTIGIYQEGTKLNKETLLNTAAEASIWGDSAPPTPTPSLAFQNLGGRMNSAESSITSLGSNLNTVQSSIVSLNSAKLNKAGDTMTGVLHMQSRIEMNEKAIDHPGSISMSGNIYMQEANNGEKHSITGLKDPDASSDSQNSYAISKGFADGRYLNKAGGTLMGGLSFTNDSGTVLGAKIIVGTSNNEILIKNNDGTGYGKIECGNIDASDIKCAGIQMMGNGTVTNVPNPVYTGDVANKAYVDNQILKLSCYYSFGEAHVTSHSDTSYSIIKNAIQNGSLVILNVGYEAKGTTPVVQGYAIFTNVYMDKDGAIKFYGRVYNTTQIEDITISIFPDGTWQ